MKCPLLDTLPGGRESQGVAVRCLLPQLWERGTLFLTPPPPELGPSLHPEVEMTAKSSQRGYPRGSHLSISSLPSQG